MNKLTITAILCLLSSSLFAQTSVTIVSGKRDTVYATPHYMRGLTSAGTEVKVNGKSFHVYSTGAFAAEVELTPGNNEVTILASKGGYETTDVLNIYYQEPIAPQPTSNYTIEEAKLLPEGLSMVTAGDVVKIRVKSQPGSELTWLNGRPLYELATSETNGMAGIYQGQYTVLEADPLLNSPITVKMKNGNRTTSKQVAAKLTILSPNTPLIVKSKGPAPYLNYGLGADRLGGSKIGYITEGINMQAIGKVNDLYKVQLSKNYQAWIPENQVEIINGAFKPEALTASWRVYGEGRYDYVAINLSERLAYRSFQEINPSRIVLDIFGATTNTAWITQTLTTEEVSNVSYEQIEDDVFRVFIDLKHQQPWGYSVYYENNKLVVRVKHQPKLSLKGLHVAVDAGHGGTNLGAVGTTGLNEKDINLTLAKLLKAELEKRGAKVTMTRAEDNDISMVDRILFLRQENPDVLISIHNNAGGNPFTTKGTSTYYRYPGYRPLSTAILKQMLDLGLENYGNVGSFNFSLNSPTEFPNALVEVLFMSSPSDEEKLMNKDFQQSVAKKIAEGLNEFITNAK